MKRFLSIIRYLFLLSLTVNVRAADGSLPKNIRTVLMEHATELQTLVRQWAKTPPERHTSRIRTPDWLLLQGHVIKYGIKRVANANKMRKVIQDHRLDSLAVPQKYVYQVLDEGMAPSDKNSIVIAEAVKGITGGYFQLDFQQAQQLYSAVINTPHYDMHRSNYIRTVSEKIYIIDTDEEAIDSYSWRRPLGRLIWGDRIQIGKTLIFFDPVESLLFEHENTYEDTANAWLFSVIQQRRKVNRLKRYLFYGLIAASGAAAYYWKYLSSTIRPQRCSA